MPDKVGILLALALALALPPAARAQMNTSRGTGAPLLPPPGGSPAGQGNVSINPVPGNVSGMENSRIYVPGNLGTPGHWQINGDGSGPTIINGEVILPNANLGRYPANMDGYGGQRFPTSQQILDGVQRSAPQEPPAPPPPPLSIVPIRGKTPAELMEMADSSEPSTRGSALAALGALEAPPAARDAAIQKLIAALDDDDLRIVRQAAMALGQQRAEKAAAKLENLLNLDDKPTLIQVAAALGRIGNPASKRPLAELGQSQDPELAKAAQQAIAAIDNAALLKKLSAAAASRPSAPPTTATTRSLASAALTPSTTPPSVAATPATTSTSSSAATSAASGPSH